MVRIVRTICDPSRSFELVLLPGVVSVCHKVRPHEARKSVQGDDVMAIARRTVLAGLAGVSLSAILADPGLARAAASGLETVSLTTDGGRSVGAALAMPAQRPTATIMLVHEWWGLNDQIKAVAAELAREGYMALAIDLYSGRVATDRDTARSLVGSVEADAATDTVASWARWLKAHSDGNKRLGTVGWCFGGGWALNAALAESADATVVYYGNVQKTKSQLKSLDGPVLGHFAKRDKWINKEMVDAFTHEMEAAQKPLTVHWYEADHAFANPTGARYDEADAALSWQRTLAFFKANLS